VQHQKSRKSGPAEGEGNRRPALERRSLGARDPFTARRESHDQRCCNRRIGKITVEIAEGHPCRKQDQKRRGNGPCGP